jgi:hypothetical protein
MQDSPAAFAERCGVSEAAVLGWEARADETARIEPAVEHRLRELAFGSLSDEAQRLVLENTLGLMLTKVSPTQLVVAMLKALWDAVRAPKTQEPFYPAPQLLWA